MQVKQFGGKTRGLVKFVITVRNPSEDVEKAVR